MKSPISLEPVGEMISLIGADNFGARFHRVADRLIGIDHCTAFVSADSSPRAVLAEAQNEKVSLRVRKLADRYIAEGHRHDSIWAVPNTKAECRAFLLSPNEMSDEGYRHEYYVQPNIKQELALVAAVNGQKIYVGFYREHGREQFSDTSLRLIRYYGLAILSVIGKHAEIKGGQMSEPPFTEPHPVNRDELFLRVREILLKDVRVLTRREAEICASIVLGYTVLGISLNLGISINTVATHRKRAYAKLQISSQNELFARYFSLIEDNLDVLRRAEPV